MMGYNRQTKVTIVNFSKKSPGSICPKISYGTLYFTIRFNIFFETSQHYDGIHEIDKINVRQFFKKSPVRANWQFGPDLTQICDTLYLMICSTARIFLRCGSIMEYSRQTKYQSIFSKNDPFRKKDNLDPIWPKIFQPYIS